MVLRHVCHIPPHTIHVAIPLNHLPSAPVAATHTTTSHSTAMLSALPYSWEHATLYNNTPFCQGNRCCSGMAQVTHATAV